MKSQEMFFSTAQDPDFSQALTSPVAAHLQKMLLLLVVTTRSHHTTWLLEQRLLPQTFTLYLYMYILYIYIYTHTIYIVCIYILLCKPAWLNKTLRCFLSCMDLMPEEIYLHGIFSIWETAVLSEI